MWKAMQRNIILKQTTQVETTSSNNAVNNVDMDSLEKDLKALEDGKYNGKWEDELEAKLMK